MELHELDGPTGVVVGPETFGDMSRWRPAIGSSGGGIIISPQPDMMVVTDSTNPGGAGAVLVGGGIAVSLRVLGVAKGARLERFRGFFPVMGLGAALAVWYGRDVRAAWRRTPLWARLSSLVLAAGVAAMLLGILSGPAFIAFLRRNEFGQQIREEGPAAWITLDRPERGNGITLEMPRELAACAEAAMMTAKAQGKNQVVLYDEEGARL